MPSEFQVHSKFELYEVAFYRWLLRYRVAVVLACLLLTACCTYGFRYFVLENDYRVFFRNDDPKLQAYEAMQNAFSKDDTVFFVVTAKNGEIFCREVFEALAYLTEESWKLPFVLRVDSLSNFQRVWADEDDLYVRPLIEDPATATQEDFARAKEAAFLEDLLVNRLLKPGSPVTGVNLLVQIPETVVNGGGQLTREAERLARQTAERFPAVSVAVTGIIPLNDAFRSATIKDLQTLVPIMLVLLVVMMTILLRSLLLALSIAIVVLMSVLITVGTYCMLGYEVSGPVSPAPLVILTLAVSDCIHIITTMQQCLRDGMTRKAAITETMRINQSPVFLTSLTTAFGFFSMNFVGIPPIQAFGNLVLGGVIVAWFLAVVFLPAFLAVLPLRVRQSRLDRQVERAMMWTAEAVLRWRVVPIVGFAALTVVFGYFITKLEINNQFVDWFEKGYPIRATTEYAMENLTGIYVLSYPIPAKGPDGVMDPEYLEGLDRLANWFRQQPGVVHVRTIADTMKRLNKALHADDPAMYRLPETREMAAQYLLLYEMSLPQGIDLNSEINVDKSATLFSVTTANLSSEKMTVLRNRAREWMHANLPEYMRTDVVGLPVLFADISRTMIESMWISSPMTIVLVMLAIMVSLRSVVFGLLSLPTNLIPIIVGFGTWAAMGWTMNFSMSSIISITVGIIVDNCIHFMSKYLRARRQYGLTTEDAIRYAYAHCGKALWAVAVVLATGFGVLALSPMVFSDNLGVLSAIIMTLALGSNLLLLPALLLYLDRRERIAVKTLEEIRHEEQLLAAEG